MTDISDWETPKVSNLVVGGVAGGVIRIPTYFLIAFFLIPTNSGGVYFQLGCLLMALAGSLREIAACFKIAFAGDGKKFTVMSARIDLDPEESVSFVFRPFSFSLVEKLRERSIDDSIDVTPKLLSDPDGLVGDLNISIGGKPLQLEGCRYQVIGFERYRVSSCDGLLEPLEPHVSVTLSGATEVCVIGRVTEDAAGFISSKRHPILIVEPKALNGFLRYNLFRFIILCALFSLLITNWASIS